MTSGDAESFVYVRADGAVDAEVEGRLVVLSPVDFSYHAVDEIGARIWALLQSPTTLPALVDRLTVEFDVDGERCRADVAPFLDRMVEIGVVARTAS